MARSMGRAESLNSNFYDLPEEILIQILVRLPVKSLLRFRSVCQHWYSLISDSAFIQVHLKTSSQNSYIILRNYQYEVKYSIRYDDESFREYFEPQLPSHILQQFLWLHGSCNGLICLSNGRDTICLWNPALGKLKTLPKSLILNSTSNFDHNYGSTTRVAFGFHPGVNDYKVVRIISYKNGYLTEVYSLSTDSWRRIDVAPPCFSFCSKPAIVNGAAYWVAEKKTDEGCYCYLLVRFEMGDEVFEEVMLPDGGRGCHQYNIAVLGETLYLFRKCPSNRGCESWTMECGKTDSWTKRFTVVVGVEPRRVVCLRKSGELLVTNHESDQLLTYNIETQRGKDLGNHGYLSYAYSYVESLIQL